MTVLNKACYWRLSQRLPNSCRHADAFQKEAGNPMGIWESARTQGWTGAL